MFSFTMDQLYSVDAFWMSATGIISLFVFLGVSLFNVYWPYCNDTVIDRVLYLSTAFVSAISLYQLCDTGYPVNTTASLIVIFAIRQANNTLKRVLRKHWPSVARKYNF